MTTTTTTTTTTKTTKTAAATTDDSPPLNLENVPTVVTFRDRNKLDLLCGKGWGLAFFYDASTSVVVMNDAKFIELISDVRNLSFDIRGAHVAMPAFDMTLADSEFFGYK